MIICKLKPEYSQCRGCLEEQVKKKEVYNCAECDMNTVYYPLMYTTEHYAYLEGSDGPVMINKERIYDIREAE